MLHFVLDASDPFDIHRIAWTSDAPERVVRLPVEMYTSDYIKAAEEALGISSAT